MKSETLTLLELNGLVRQVIEHTLDRDYWVEAELSECRESKGHCYMELIEKDEFTNTPVARAQARCWRSTWSIVQPYFERITGQQMHAGMKVRMKVRAQFHEAFGFSWIVSDIDPTFTLGDMARRRQEIIRQLKAEGVFDLQKELSLPVPCLRIAVVSSATAAGYGDFAAQLRDTPFRFETRLFPATMQGEQVEESIIAALDSIYQAAAKDDFDCVVIIRGGGATADLSGFDTLPLAENVAQFPLPIITGIGHDRDESVLDMVSHLRVKTPTAAAQYLIDQAQTLLRRIDTAQERIAHQARTAMEYERLRLGSIAERMPTLFSLVRTRQEARLDSIGQQLTALVGRRTEAELQRLTMAETRCQTAVCQRMERERHRLELIGQRVRSVDPAILLRRGYSITLKDGHALSDPAQAKPGDLLETRLAKGVIHSTVN